MGDMTKPTHGLGNTQGRFGHEKAEGECPPQARGAKSGEKAPRSFEAGNPAKSTAKPL